MARVAFIVAAIASSKKDDSCCPSLNACPWLIWSAVEDKYPVSNTCSKLI
ncbi:hypothetical protein BFJ68_g18505 [Fusarium oxysporum]|uniref:Uncharacterized protein n=1 Tax=Fusarium oxysporum TaxID=5507 RepID=A0A420MK34_FUSOX|nr:hypothetical protein BFJ68_g18505 [Fusarium oxysporum]